MSDPVYRRALGVLALLAVGFFGASWLHATQPQVVVPLYGAAAAGPDLSEVVRELRGIREELKRLRELAEAAGGAGGGGGEQRAGAPDLEAAKAALRRNCASCHNEKAADDDGGGLALFLADGSFAMPTPEQRARIWRRVNRGQMPPPDSGVELSDGDRKAVLDWSKP